MSKVFSDISLDALVASTPALSDPHTAPEGVELRLLYNPFEPEEVEVHELEFVEGKTLSAYIGDLPSEAEWMVFYNGVEIEDLAATSSTVVSKGDRIGVLMLPLGGDGMKGVFRIVLQAAAIALAFVPGIGWAAALAINIGIGLINAFLLTPKPRINDEESERSYGIDGAKNSATEGIPYPVVYGRFRVAGNFSDTFTENVGDDQYLYLRTILNDGVVSAITEVELNEQPIENFKQTQARYALGTLDQPANDWFARSVVQKNKASKLETTWTTHITTEAVDKVRFDLTFTQGLVHITEKKGRYEDRSVTFQCEYRQLDPVTKEPLGDGTFAFLPQTTPFEYGNGFVGGTYSLSAGVLALKIAADTAAADAANVAADPKIQYRLVGAVEWTDLPVTSDTAQDFIYDQIGDGTISGETNVTPRTSLVYELDLPAGDYEFQMVDGAAVEEATLYPTTSTQSVTITDRRTRQIRRSIESERLDRGFYEVRIRRTSATATSKYDIDECFLSDVAEIDLDPVNLRGTANLALRIKLNEQLNQIPTVSSLVEGCVLKEYDVEGNVVQERWSANPAWIALDVLTHEQRGALIASNRIDWPAWVELAEYCDDNNITFNGVFEAGSNVGDVLREVCRVGHTAPIPMGTKISVAIDRVRDPVMAFGQGNILEGSFKLSYLTMTDRANDFEVSYFDKNDRNKQKAIRYVDPKAVTFNEMPRKASVTLRGVDNIAQAQGELWRMIYGNRLILRTCEFETNLELIALNLGDVALIQHPMMQWGNSGRLKAGSTDTAINLDQPVETEFGENYAALVHFDAIALGMASVNSVVGKRVLVPTSTLSDAENKARMHRMALTGDSNTDFEIVKVEKGATYDSIYLAVEPVGVTAGTSVTFWQSDHIAERDVTSLVQNGDGTTTVNLASALPGAPKEFSNFVFGKKVLVKRPFTLTGISGEGIERRSLTFVEYNEAVYDPQEVDIPVPTNRVSNRQVAHVRKLLFDYENVAEAYRRVINVRLHWSSEDIIDYGGADLYMSLNGSPFRPAGNALGASEYHVQLSPEDTVVFKVVAYNSKGIRAPIATAPEVSGDLLVDFAELDPPLNFVASSIAFQVEGTAEFSWDPPVDPTGIESYEIQYKRSVDAEWIVAGTFTSGPVNLAGIQTGTYDARIRAVSATSISIWATANFSVVVTPGSFLANYNAGNDRNADPINAPTLPVSGSVEHTLNSDGSANISVEWLWGDDEGDIDGFRIDITQT